MKRIFCRLVMAVVMVALSMTAGAQGRVKVGLVLGGGGAKGAAEVGALKVIEKAGVHIDYICGTSIGSIVGGLYSMGYRSADIERMFQSQEWKSLLTDRNDSLSRKLFARDADGVQYVFGFPVRRRHTAEADTLPGIFKGSKVLMLLDSMVRTSPVARGVKGVRRIPFRCVAADVAHGDFREVVLSADSAGLDSCMRASMAIPGVFKPMKIGQNVLIDGGALNNLPVDVARKMGADIVIAIDLQQSEQKPKKPDYDLSMVSGIAEMLGFGGLLNWVITRPDISKYHENVKLADIYIHPSLPDADASSFGNKNSARMIKIGEQEALKHWDELMKLKEQLVSQ